MTRERFLEVREEIRSELRADLAFKRWHRNPQGEASPQPKCGGARAAITALLNIYHEIRRSPHRHGDTEYFRRWDYKRYYKKYREMYADLLAPTEEALA